MDHIYKLYKNEPFVVPAEIIYSDNFGAYTHGNDIDATKQFKFTNVKEVCILFPRHVSDLTVQFNPYLNKLYFNIFNHNYPNKKTNTTSTRFLRSQLEAIGLDTILQATESLEQSYVSPPSYQFQTRDRSISYDTNFIFIIPVKQLRANLFFFDKLNNNTNTENITITNTFITDKDGNKVDNYTFLNRNNNQLVSGSESYNRTPPIISLVTDTFWLFTSNNRGSVEYNTKEAWDELFKKMYPEIYQRLMNEYLSKYS
jgi:hypothetical protein